MGDSLYPFILSRFKPTSRLATVTAVTNNTSLMAKTKQTFSHRNYLANLAENLNTQAR